MPPYMCRGITGSLRSIIAYMPLRDSYRYMYMYTYIAGKWAVRAMPISLFLNLVSHFSLSAIRETLVSVSLHQPKLLHGITQAYQDVSMRR